MANFNFIQDGQYYVNDTPSSIPSYDTDYEIIVNNKSNLDPGAGGGFPLTVTYLDEDEEPHTLSFNVGLNNPVYVNNASIQTIHNALISAVNAACGPAYYDISTSIHYIIDNNAYAWVTGEIGWGYPTYNVSGESGEPSYPAVEFGYTNENHTNYIPIIRNQGRVNYKLQAMWAWEYCYPMDCRVVQDTPSVGKAQGKDRVALYAEGGLVETLQDSGGAYTILVDAQTGTYRQYVKNDSSDALIPFNVGRSYILNNTTGNFDSVDSKYHYYNKMFSLNSLGPFNKMTSMYKSYDAIIKYMLAGYTYLYIMPGYTDEESYFTPVLQAAANIESVNDTGFGWVHSGASYKDSIKVNKLKGTREASHEWVGVPELKVKVGSNWRPVTKVYVNTLQSGTPTWKEVKSTTGVFPY